MTLIKLLLIEHQRLPPPLPHGHPLRHVNVVDPVLERGVDDVEEVDGHHEGVVETVGVQPTEAEHDVVAVGVPVRVADCHQVGHVQNAQTGAEEDRLQDLFVGDVLRAAVVVHLLCHLVQTAAVLWWKGYLRNSVHGLRRKERWS